MSENKHTEREQLARCESMSRLQAVISGKWKILIIWYISAYRVQRFNELQRRLDGITQATLTRQLRELEEDGFISRRVYPQVPPRVEYSLTKRVKALFRYCLICRNGARKTCCKVYLK